MELNSEWDRDRSYLKQLKKENSKLVEENTKMTKRRSKFLCKIKELEKEKSELFTIIRGYVYNGSKSKESFKTHKEFKPLLKKYKKQINKT